MVKGGAVEKLGSNHDKCSNKTGLTVQFVESGENDVQVGLLLPVNRITNTDLINFAINRKAVGPCTKMCEDTHLTRQCKRPQQPEPNPA